MVTPHGVIFSLNCLATVILSGLSRKVLTQLSLSNILSLMDLGYKRNQTLIDLTQRADIHAALGNSARLAIVDSLYFSDRSPSELKELLGMESNLLAHHLEVLDEAGLICRLRSSADKRRRYLRLDLGRLSSSLPIPILKNGSVLFVCTRNSARSQMAAALWNKLSDNPAESAGTEPAELVHPLAVETAARHGLDLTGAVPKNLDAITTLPQIVVTVCDHANERLRQWQERRLHWSVPDPIERGEIGAFEDAFNMLEERVSTLVSRIGSS